MILSNICRKSSTTIVRKTSATFATGFVTSAENHDTTNNDFNPLCFEAYNEINALSETPYSATAFTDFYGKQELAPKCSGTIVKNISDITSFAIHSAPIQNRLYRLIPDINGQMVASPSGEELAQNYLNASTCWSESINSQSNYTVSNKNFDKSLSFLSQPISSTTSTLSNEVLTTLASQNSNSTQTPCNNIIQMSNVSTESNKNSDETIPLTYATTSTIPLSAFSMINAMPVNEIPSFAVPIAPSTNAVSADNNYLNNLFGISEFAEMIREGDGGASQFQKMEREEQSELNLVKPVQLNEIKNKSKRQNNFLLKIFGSFLFKPSLKVSV